MTTRSAGPNSRRDPAGRRRKQSNLYIPVDGVRIAEIDLFVATNRGCIEPVSSEDFRLLRQALLDFGKGAAAATGGA